MLALRQLFDPASSTFTYLIADEASQRAVLVDPVFEQARRDAALIRELGLTLAATIDTHVHADHVTGAWLHKERLGSTIIASARGGATLADRLVAHGDRIALGARHLTVRATPGHTSGCTTLVLDDESLALTGDCLLVRGTGRTDFQGGDARALFRSVREQIWTLPNACALYPGHDYRGISVTSVGEERHFNPRLGGGASEDDFALYVANLELPMPRAMEHAVPANLRCGRPAGAVPDADPDWADVTLAFAGFWEITPSALEEVASRVTILDVREPHERTGPLGAMRDAVAIPLGEVGARAAELASDRPIVAICRSGARSAQAAVLLGKRGRRDVASLAGGLLRWRAEGHAVIGGAE